MRHAVAALILVLPFSGGCRQAPAPLNAIDRPLSQAHDVRYVSTSLPGWTLTIPAAEPNTMRGVGPQGATLFLRRGTRAPAAEALRDRIPAPEFDGEPHALDKPAGATLRYAHGTIEGVRVYLAILDVPREGGGSAGFMAVPEERGESGRLVLQQQGPQIGKLENEHHQDWKTVDIVVVNMYFTPAAPLPRTDITLHVVAHNRGDTAGTGVVKVSGFKDESDKELPGFEEKQITLGPKEEGELTWMFKADEGDYQFNGMPASVNRTASARVAVKPKEPGDAGPGPTGPTVPGPTGPTEPLGFVAPDSPLRVIALIYPIPVTAGKEVILSAVVDNDTPADGVKVVVGRVVAARVDAAGESPLVLWRRDDVAVPAGEQRLVNYFWTPKKTGRYTFFSGEKSHAIDVQ